MPASFVGFTYVPSAGATLSQTVAVPTGTVSQDVMLALVRGNARVESPAPPAGWTTLLQGTSGPVNPTIYYRVAGAAEPTSYSFPYAGDVAIVTYRGLDVTSVVAGHGAATVSGLDVYFPSLSTSAAHAMYVAWPRAQTSATGDVWPPNGMAERFDKGNNAVVDERVPSGSTGTRLSRYGGSISDTFGGHAVLLNEANVAPNVPTLTTMASGGIVAAQDVNRAAHQHSDPDGDVQAAFRIRYRLVGATTWTQPADQATVNQFYDFPAASLAVGDYERQVQTFDGKLWGGWSASGFFTVASRPSDVPTFVSPINGQTIGSADITVEVSATDFDTLELRVLDAAGAVLVPIQSSTNGLFNVTGLANSQTVTLQARKVKATLTGAWSSISNPVSYTPPAQALVSVAAAPAAYALVVQVVNPAPVGGQPPRSYSDILVTALDPGDKYRPLGVEKLAASRFTGSVFADARVASDIRYGYRVRTVATNGTESMSDFVTGETALPVDDGFELLDLYAEHYMDSYGALRDVYIDEYTDTYGNHGTDPVPSTVEGTV